MRQKVFFLIEETEESKGGGGNGREDTSQRLFAPKAQCGLSPVQSGPVSCFVRPNPVRLGPVWSGLAGIQARILEECFGSLVLKL